MRKSVNKLERDQLFDLDQFFKIQFNGKSRYGTMGSFFWKIFINPFGKGFVNAIHHDAKIVATTSITPKKLLINQMEISAGEIGDTYTDRKFQGRGFFSLLVNESRQMAKNSGIKLIYGTPNNQSLPGYIKNNGFKIVNEIQIKSYRFELKVYNILYKKVGKFFASILNSIFYLFILLLNSFLYILQPINKNYKLESTNYLDKNWNVFWNEVSEEWDFIFSRNYVDLNWRYFLNPEIYSFIIVKEEEKIVGYTVYRILPDKIGNRAVIADFLFLKNHNKAFNTCIKEIKKHCIDLDLNSITIWCDSNSPYKKIIIKNGFIAFREIPLICYINDFLMNIKWGKKIHFTMSDSDNI
jgi:hypothetical protein